MSTSNADDHGRSGREDSGHRALILAARRQVAGVGAVQGTGALPCSEPQGGGTSRGAVSVPGYRIVREVHRGGQGVVYQAVQEATQRHVAIKVLRDGSLATASERARFEREVLVLAQLSHPNIVTVHDSGETASGQYYVMDYIRGLPLDAYIAEKKLGVRRILELMAVVCEAVNAAHVRGVIHRDIKPGNIRVDEEGVPHVLDFGLAKVAWGGPDARSAFTETGQFLGSLPWASPEHVSGDSSRVDVRSDVYGLGAVMYEALTGRVPHDVGGAMAEALRRIAQETPVAPSAAATGARASGIDDEIDTIVMTCLATDPQRRYQSAGEVALDLRRYLKGEPIAAKRDSVGYVLRKQISRHRLAAGSAAGFVLLLTVGLGVTASLWRMSERHRTAAEMNLQAAEEAQAALKRESENVRSEYQRAENVKKLLIRSFKAADPKHGGDRTLSAKDALDRAAGEAMANTMQDARTQAEYLLGLGEIYQNLGDHARAIELLAKAFEIVKDRTDIQSSFVATVATQLGAAQAESGEHEAAIKSYRIGYDLIADAFGENDWHMVALLVRSLRSQGRMAEAEPVLRNVVERWRGKEVHVSTMLAAMNGLGESLSEQGKHAECADVMKDALAYVERVQPTTRDFGSAIRNNLGYALLQAGRAQEGLGYAELALSQRRAKLPPEHLDIASSAFVTGSIKLALGDKAGARTLLEECVRIREAKLPATDERVRDAREMLGKCE